MPQQPADLLAPAYHQDHAIRTQDLQAIQRAGVCDPQALQPEVGPRQVGPLPANNPLAAAAGAATSHERQARRARHQLARCGKPG